MSTVHIALFKWKPEITDQQVEEALNLVRDLKSKVPGIIDIKCGKNYHKYSQGFTDGVVVVGESPDAIDAYRQHPEHETVAEMIENMELDGIGFDFDD